MMRTEEVGMRGGGSCDDAAISENDLVPGDAIESETPEPAVETKAATKNVTARSNIWACAVRQSPLTLREETESYIAQSTAGADGRRGALDVDVVELGEVDDEGAILTAKTEGGVRAAGE